jgi:hypothetical protein
MLIGPLLLWAKDPANARYRAPGGRRHGNCDVGVPGNGGELGVARKISSPEGLPELFNRRRRARAYGEYVLKVDETVVRIVRCFLPLGRS